MPENAETQEEDHNQSINTRRDRPLSAANVVKIELVQNKQIQVVAFDRADNNKESAISITTSQKNLGMFN